MKITCSTILVGTVSVIVLVGLPALAQWGGGGLDGRRDNHPDFEDEDYNFQAFEFGGGEAVDNSGGFDPIAEMPASVHFGDRNGDETNNVDPALGGFIPTARKGYVPPKGFRSQRGPSIKDIAELQREGALGGRSSSPRFDPSLYSGDAGDEGEVDASWELPFQDEVGPDGQRQHLDKCLRQVARFCSFRIMHENFAMFVDCVSASAGRIREECFDWASSHRPCTSDVKENCMFMSPPETTECMLASKAKLSDECVDSKWFKSMEEGYAEFQQKMEESFGESGSEYTGEDGSGLGHASFEPGDEFSMEEQNANRHGFGGSPRGDGDEL